MAGPYRHLPPQTEEQRRLLERQQAMEAEEREPMRYRHLPPAPKEGAPAPDPEWQGPPQPAFEQFVPVEPAETKGASRPWPTDKALRKELYKQILQTAADEWIRRRLSTLSEPKPDGSPPMSPETRKLVGKRIAKYIAANTNEMKASAKALYQSGMFPLAAQNELIGNAIASMIMVDALGMSDYKGLDTLTDRVLRLKNVPRAQREADITSGRAMDAKAIPSWILKHRGDPEAGWQEISGRGRQREVAAGRTEWQQEMAKKGPPAWLETAATEAMDVATFGLADPLQRAIQSGALARGGIPKQMQSKPAVPEDWVGSPESWDEMQTAQALADSEARQTERMQRAHENLYSALGGQIFGFLAGAPNLAFKGIGTGLKGAGTLTIPGGMQVAKEAGQIGRGLGAILTRGATERAAQAAMESPVVRPLMTVAGKTLETSAGFGLSTAPIIAAETAGPAMLPPELRTAEEAWRVQNFPEVLLEGSGEAARFGGWMGSASGVLGAGARAVRGGPRAGKYVTAIEEAEGTVTPIPGAGVVGGATQVRHPKPLIPPPSRFGPSEGRKALIAAVEKRLPRGQLMQWAPKARGTTAQARTSLARRTERKVKEQLDREDESADMDLERESLEALAKHNPYVSVERELEMIQEELRSAEWTAGTRGKIENEVRDFMRQHWEPYETTRDVRPPKDVGYGETTIPVTERLAEPFEPAPLQEPYAMTSPQQTARAGVYGEMQRATEGMPVGKRPAPERVATPMILGQPRPNVGIEFESTQGPPSPTMWEQRWRPETAPMPGAPRPITGRATDVPLELEYGPTHSRAGIARMTEQEFWPSQVPDVVVTQTPPTEFGVGPAGFRHPTGRMIPYPGEAGAMGYKRPAMERHTMESPPREGMPGETVAARRQQFEMGQRRSRNERIDQLQNEYLALGRQALGETGEAKTKLQRQANALQRERNQLLAEEAAAREKAAIPIAEVDYTVAPGASEGFRPPSDIPAGTEEFGPWPAFRGRTPPTGQIEGRQKGSPITVEGGSRIRVPKEEIIDRRTRIDEATGLEIEYPNRALRAGKMQEFIRLLDKLGKIEAKEVGAEQAIFRRIRGSLASKLRLDPRTNQPDPRTQDFAAALDKYHNRRLVTEEIRQSLLPWRQLADIYGEKPETGGWEIEATKLERAKEARDPTGTYRIAPALRNIDLLKAISAKEELTYHSSTAAAQHGYLPADPWAIIVGRGMYPTLLGGEKLLMRPGLEEAYRRYYELKEEQQK